jgi:hypothetical protein
VAPTVEQLIILGLVPGTNIQIGFDLLARIVAIATIVYLVSLMVKEKRFQYSNSQDTINNQSI